MKTSRVSLLTLLFFLSTTALTQEKRIYETIRVENPPKIDGTLDDPQWDKAPIATDFTVVFPENGKKARQKTEAKLIYDDKALYIGAYMHENSEEGVRVQLTKRDEMGIGDYFGILINPYNDDQSVVRIFVTSAGVQWDRAETQSWNIVYKTAVHVNDSGWTAEMEIPYSALRFPKNANQDWAFTYLRGHSNLNSESSWNPIDLNNPNIPTQLGILRGIKDIDPPVRLFLTPYFSTYLNHCGENNIWTTNYKGGLDLKYGINESFTLDMMLIPDFGQIQSDDIIQNLTPFETYYHEQRQFFTEGQGLFNRGHMFYSRRIGSKPRNRGEAEDDLQENEEVIENPSETKLINATKISGKTKNGISIGVLNAMTNPMHAVIRDTITAEERKFKTQSFTNYNVSVIEKSLKYNSYVTLINTNVSSPSDDFSSNVLGTAYNFYDKNTNYNLSGWFAYSRVKDEAGADIEDGIKYRIHIGKENGSFRWGMARNVESDRYNQNHLGYSRNNNYIQHAISLNHHITKPTWIIKEWRSEIFAQYSTLYKPVKFAHTDLILYSGGTFKNNFRFGNYFLYTPRARKDHDESRVEGRVFKRAKRIELGGHFTTNNNKQLVYRHRYEIEKKLSGGTTRFMFQFDPSIRFNGKISLHYNFSYNMINGNYGYVDDDEDTGNITFGRRDRKTIINQIRFNYIFNNKSSLSFKLRHYCSATKYEKFYNMEHSGDLADTDYYSDEHDVTFNTFSIDMVYRWEFSPGSELSIVWKNAIENEQEGEYYSDYSNNVKNLFDSHQFNSLSVKILYYLDWQYLKKSR